MRDDPETEPDEETAGYLFTHWDCPKCGEPQETEGDATREVLECPDCRHTIRITHT